MNDTDDNYPFWVNRVGGLCTIADGFVQLLTPWMPSLTINFYTWWLNREGKEKDNG